MIKTRCKHAGVFLLGCFLVSLTGYGQSLKRQTIASSVGGKTEDGVVMGQTIGQPYQTKTKESGGIFYRPGFQQPVFRTELLKTTVAVTILPNPAIYSFFIECSDSLTNADLSAYDEAGRLVYTEHIEYFKRHEVNCNNWANGVYIITVTDKKNNLISAKLIKHQ